LHAFQHEELSKLMFKKILLDNSRVLAAFVGCGMGLEEVKMIEKMIDPPSGEKKQFLYEVHISVQF
jgi:hypothetical protein